MRFVFEVKAPDQGRRLDRFVQGALGQVPPGLVQRLLRRKKVRVDGRREPGSYRVQLGDEVVVHHAPQASARPTESDARTFEGPAPELLLRVDGFLVVNKPAGIACSDDGEDRANLPLWLRSALAAEIASGEVRPEPCHRLDRGTTGLVLVSLHAAAHDRFRLASQEGELEKHYEVAVWAEVRGEHRCDIPLVRRTDAARGEPRMVPAPEADEAVSARTDFASLRRALGCTRLAARLHTGRTHQIRAHCHALGWPVVGDGRYGDPAMRDREAAEGISHPLLHARRLAWPGVLDVEAAWPPAEAAALLSLGL